MTHDARIAITWVCALVAAAVAANGIALAFMLWRS